MSNVICNRGETAFADEREFWRSVLLAGGFTALPRWTLDPVAGVGEHETRIPDQLAATLCRLADQLAMPLSSVLLTAHAKVLGAVSGESEVCTGYALELGSPLPIRMTLGPRSWRELLLDASRAEAELLAHRHFSIDDLRRELGINEPVFETVFELGAPGHVGWHELFAADRDQAFAFYAELFGWQVAADPAMGGYGLVDTGAGEGAIGGGIGPGKGPGDRGVKIYMRVDDLEPTWAGPRSWAASD